MGARPLNILMVNTHQTGSGAASVIPGAAYCNGRVTAVIPTYNRAALLPRAVESALTQTARRLCDIVVIDDGSTDRTPEVARRFGREITYLRQRNAGASAARNTAIRVQPNEFVAFLDSDDQWLPETVERQLDAMRRHTAVALVAGRARWQSPDGRQGEPDVPPIPRDQPFDIAPHLFESCFIATPSVMVRAAHLAQTRLFDPRLRVCHDHYLWLQLACRAPAVYLDAHLTTYSQGAPLSLTRNRERAKVEEVAMRYLLLRELRRRPDCRAYWRRGLARALGLLRDWTYHEGRYAAAARYGFRSLMVQPRGRARWEWGRLAHALLRCTRG